MVTTTVTAAEVNGAVFVAVLDLAAVDVSDPVAEVAVSGVTVIPIKPGPEVCTALKVSGVSAGTLGSEPLAMKLPPVPETTVIGFTALTVGAVGALIVNVVGETEEPPQLVAVRVKGTTVVTATIGAVKTGFAMDVFDNTPIGGGPQEKVIGGVPVALPASVTVPPDATV